MLQTRGEKRTEKLATQANQQQTHALYTYMASVWVTLVESGGPYHGSTYLD